MATETALVTGGCGCIGFSVVKALLQEPSISKVHVFSRNPSKNLHPEVEYHAGSLTSEKDIESIFSIVQPTVLFHIASPIMSGTGSTTANEYYKVNVGGTKKLLDCANKTGVVKVSDVLRAEITYAVQI